MSHKKNVSTWITLSRFWKIIFPFKTGLIIAIIALIANAVSDTLTLSLLKPLLDDGFSKTNRNILIWMPLSLVALMILRGISGFIANYCISWVSGNVVMKIRYKLFNHIMDMPVSFFDQQSTGALLSKITYDVDQVTYLSSGTIITVVREGAYITSLFIVMFYYSWQLSLIILIVAPIIYFIIILVSRHFRKISAKIQNTMGVITTSAEQMLKGHKEVLIFGGQNIENKRFKLIINRMRQQGMKMVSASSFYNPLIQFIASLALACILYAASFPSIIETLTAGVITVVFSSMIALMRPLKALTNVNAQFQRGMSACQTIFSILDMQTEKDNGLLEIKNKNGNIIFNHVTFFYPGKNTASLNDINLVIPAGNTIALVGRSGSGKSTIANLIIRLYDVQKGNIFFDGINLRNYKLTSLRDHIALVSQNIYLFNDTIANNIAYASKEIYSRKAIEKAAYMAYAMEFISKMKYGLDTVINENGIILSGGQRQRIAIARALLRNCQILILDEATSSLDMESEKKIQKAIDTLRKNRTSLIITHRISSIEKADEILVLDNGYIVERGTHKILIAHQGVYAKLHQLQFNK